MPQHGSRPGRGSGPADEDYGATFPGRLWYRSPAMAKPNRGPGGGPTGGGPQGARPSLIPANPLSGTAAVVQTLILLGIPLALLFAFKFVLKRFFPELGY